MFASPPAGAVPPPSAPPEPGSVSLTLRGITFAPARFGAPLSGFTHSALRRLVADFGGHGGLFTEMLCGHWLLREDLARSPAVKRRPAEGPVIYQLMLTEPEQATLVVDRLAPLRPAGLDLNGACPAPKIRQRGAGAELFADAPRLGAMVAALRRAWPGLLTVKIRLGQRRPDWWAVLGERLQQLEDLGVDAVTVHPRFADEKLKRRARHELFPQLLARTRLPLIACGDLHGPEAVRRHAVALAGVAGVMVGRMMVVRPWVFRAWQEPGFRPDPAAVWRRYAQYVREDFPEPGAFQAAKAFVTYFARNFRFGHRLYTLAQRAGDWRELEASVNGFFEPPPDWLNEPDLSGLA